MIVPPYKTPDLTTSTRSIVMAHKNTHTVADLSAALHVVEGIASTRTTTSNWVCQIAAALATAAAIAQSLCHQEQAAAKSGE